MNEIANTFRGGILVSFRLIVLGLVISSCLGISTLTQDWIGRPRRTPMHKVLLTQKGYIQFLRWELPVPEFEEFTFCLWLVSNDLTHAHSIFSYSKNERDRLVRSWISPQGRSVHLEIGGTEIFAARTNIRQNRWYHICQSWESRAGRYALWINGQVKHQGHSLETIKHAVPSGGDIVLGQEYTDFDKGLEEGIEGAVLGFNLLLASSFSPLSRNYEEAFHDSIPRSSVSSYATVPFLARIPMEIMQRDIDYESRAIIDRQVESENRNHDSKSIVAFPRVWRGRRSIEASVDVTGPANPTNHTRSERDILRVASIPRGTADHADARIKFDTSRVQLDPLGLQLVKLSYVHCEIGRGSPFIGGSLMLISWTRTPVRVFGGATLKNVKGSCGNF